MAAPVFDVPYPSNIGNAVGITCSAGGTGWLAFPDNASPATSQGPCGSNWTPTIAGTYHIVECNTVLGDCDPSMGFTSAVMNAGYISFEDYIIVSSAPPATPPMDFSMITTWATTNLPVLLEVLIPQVLIFAAIAFLFSWLRRSFR